MPVAAAFVGGMFSFGAGTAFAAGGAAFAGWTAGAAFAGTIVGSLTVKLLTTVAMGALSSALTPDTPQGGGITISSTVTGEHQPETIILGKYATGGQAICPAYSHGTSHKFLTSVIELCSAPGAQLSRLMLGDEWFTMPAPAAGGIRGADEYGHRITTGKYRNRVWIRYYDGTQTAADPYLVGRYASHADRPWTSQMVGRGICYAILTFQRDTSGDTQLTQVPRYRFEMAGIPLYDIRKDSSAGGNGPQRLSDRSTWAVTHNPVVMIWNLVRGIPLPGGEVYGGNVTDLRRLPRDLWIAAMNRCDAAVTLSGGGTEPAYRAGLEIALDQPPAAAIEELLKAASATIADLGYGWGIVAGAPALPVYSFTDDDVIVSRQQELEPFPGLQDTYNAVAAKYPDPEHFWETRDAPQRTNAAWEAVDAFGRRMASLSLPAVPYPDQVQRLMREWIEDERRFRRHVIALPPDAAHVDLIDTIDWSSAGNGYGGKDFSTYEILEDPRIGIRQMSIRERDPNDYSWRPEFELPSGPTPAAPAPVIPETVAGYGAQGVIIRDAAGLSRRVGIMQVWNADIVAQGIRWEIRLAGTSQAILEGTTQDLARGGKTVSEGILPDTDYQIRARLILSWTTEWTDWITVRTPDVRFDWQDFEDSIRERIDAMEAEAEAAAQKAREALDAVTTIDLTVDQAVMEAREQIEIGYTSAIGDAAREVFEMSARVGQTIISVPLLEAPWTRWHTQGTVTPVANERYPDGQTWDVTVTASQQAGIALNAPPAAIWTGQMDAAGYVVEVEYTLVSGSLAGAGVALDWNTSSGEYRAQIPLSQMVSGTTVSGRTMVARGVFARPTNVAGTFSSHDLFVFANFTDFAPMSAKRIKVHRVTVRLATAEELGGGLVRAAIEAKLTNEYMTRTATDEALASSEERLNANIVGVNAEVTRAATVLAGLNGASALVTTSVVAGQQRATIRQVAWDGNGDLAPGSAIVFDANDILMRGSVGMEHLVVGLGRNLLTDPTFSDGLAHWLFSYHAGSGVQSQPSIRPAGSDWAHPAGPVLEIVQSGQATDGYAEVQTMGQISPAGNRSGIPVQPGIPFSFSAYLSSHTCACELIVTQYRADGSWIPTGTYQSGGFIAGVTGSSRNPDTWDRFHINGIGHPEAAMAVGHIRKHPTLYGSGVNYSHVFIWKPQFEILSDVNQNPGLWSPGGSSGMWDGRRLFSDTVLARHISSETMQAINGRFSSLAAAKIAVGYGEIDNARIGSVIQSDNFVGGPGGQGWRIGKDGAAEFNTITVRRRIEVASGTVDIGNHGFTDVPLTHFVSETPVPITAWAGSNNTYIAVAGMTGTVSSPNINQCYWGWVAEVQPLTKWSGNQSLRLMLRFVGRNVAALENCIVTWKIYEVS